MQDPPVRRGPRTRRMDLPGWSAERERPSWHAEAACRGVTPVMYPTVPAAVSAALRICRTCTVTAECLQFAVEAGERHGVWGGRVFGDDQLRKRMRARDEAA